MSACQADFQEVTGNGSPMRAQALGPPAGSMVLREAFCTKNSAPSPAFLTTFLRGATWLVVVNQTKTGVPSDP
eukprot:4961807-Lingulodinium_polyedra.AAC.1